MNWQLLNVGKEKLDGSAGNIVDQIKGDWNGFTSWWDSIVQFFKDIPTYLSTFIFWIATIGIVCCILYYIVNRSQKSLRWAGFLFITYLIIRCIGVVV